MIGRIEIIIEVFKKLVNKIRHKIFGCKSFWVYVFNKNSKPYKKYCKVCGARMHKINKKWILFIK